MGPEDGPNGGTLMILIQSRDEWKNKAVQRSNEIREHRKSRKRYLEQIAKLKAQVHEMSQAKEDKKTASTLKFHYRNSSSPTNTDFVCFTGYTGCRFLS